MPFDLETWKVQVSERLKDWRSRMQQAGTSSVYAFLAAATLWPVVEAARAGEWAVLAALGGVLGSVGSNLLANRIQSWKDEADAARQIATDIAPEPSLRAELNAVLKALETFTYAERALPATDRQWFLETLQTELARQGNPSRFTAQLTGSGAIAQGPGAVAAGAGGVAVGGDVLRSVFVGSTINIAGGRYTGPPIRDPDEALAIYRRVLVAGNRYMSLRGLDVGASDPTGSQQRFDLAQVYVDLDTTS